ncbi:Carboxypeptidase SOL1 [Zea mays]|uniref:Carboxypeptidase SOL1 n=1 Tax=Zea mays TaxID=4577 RepID=A0A1D6KJA6_MAIZE|nr:Carboxypeptidase SOL1 [Zea mays]
MVRGYMSNTELETAVHAFGSRCSNISRVYSFLICPHFTYILFLLSLRDNTNLLSALERWVIEISDKPKQRESEPAFKATLIVENMHLHILPTMNPDGFALRWHGNANNIDLNRDFPDQFFPVNNDIDYRQPETRAIMNWVKQEHFTTSASLHGGALVANYPWDGTRDTRAQYDFVSHCNILNNDFTSYNKHYYGCPDDKTFQHMASVYSRSHYNMSLSKEFEGGITNGAFWYPIYGGMQDWNYIHGGCFELTLEISDTKWPKADELPIIWEHSRMSMLNLLASLIKVICFHNCKNGTAKQAKISMAYSFIHRPLSDEERRVTCNDQRREVFVAQDIANKEIDRTVAFDKAWVSL